MANTTIDPSVPESKASASVNDATRAISDRASALSRDAGILRRAHQTFTVSTILLGVSVPALVTYSVHDPQWALAAVVAAALGSAAATIRTVLRFNERYSNSALTSIALLDLDAQVRARQAEVGTSVKEEFVEQKLYEVAAWARRQMFEITKAYVEKELLALKQEHLKLEDPPAIESGQKADSPKR